MRAADPAYTFSHFAGIGGGGAGSADGAAASATFNHPSAVAIDKQGNIYIADARNFTIRKLSTNGIVSTIAGKAGTPGSNDGPATTALFGQISALACDEVGNLFIGDRNSNTIRKLSPNGMVTTLAGQSGVSGSNDGTGAEARFGMIDSLVVRKNGNLLVTDSVPTLREITPAGVVTTRLSDSNFIGYGSAVAADSAGNSYVVTQQSEIVRLTPDWTPSIIAGRKDDPMTDGNGLGARFQYIRAMSVDATGNIYITQPNAIRRLAPNGDVVTLIGGANPIASAPMVDLLGNALDQSGNIYVADNWVHVIWKLSPQNALTAVAGMPERSGTVDGPANVAQFEAPAGITVDPFGNVYVCDTDAHTVRKITPSGVVSTFAGAPGLSGAQEGKGNNARFGFLSGIVSDRQGNLYVTDQGASCIWQITPDADVSVFAGGMSEWGELDGSRATARFSNPIDIAIDANDTLYVSEPNVGNIRRISKDGVSTLTQNAMLSTGLAIDSTGNLFSANFLGTIQKLTPTGAQSVLAGGVRGSVDGVGTQAGFIAPQAIAIDAVGNLFVAEPTSKLRHITPGGVVTTLLGSGPGYDDGPASVARISQLVKGIACDAAGNLYLSDAGQHTIRKATLAGSAQVTQHPTSKTVKAGRNASFDVTATNGTSYQWYKNRVAISGATRSTLTLTGVQADDAGEYVVAVTGPTGVVFSDSATLKLAETQMISGALISNISTRSFVGAGGDVLIAGFILRGTAPKTVLIRASGPALAQFSVPGLLSDPKLEIHDATKSIATNDNWGDDPVEKAEVANAFDLTNAFAWADGSKDAAVVMTLPPGLYTAIVSGAGGTTGVGLVEVYDVNAAESQAKLVNISSRSLVKTDDNVQIAGFIISGTKPKNVIIRASGPALSTYGVTGLLADPVLEVHAGGTILASNDNWDPLLRPEFQAVGIDNWAMGSKDAALMLTLNPGAYTAIVSGKGGTTGVALIEVYEDE